MKNREQIILTKDLTQIPWIVQSYPGHGEIIPLADPDAVEQNDSSASFSFDENTLHFNIICEENDFFDYEIDETIPQKDLHGQGNTIAFYIQPNGKTNFYRFEFSARGEKTVHYYVKLKNRKYKPRKQKFEWKATQDHDPQADIWSVQFDIPLDAIKIAHDRIKGTRFLIVRYRYTPTSPAPIVTNSMRLSANQLCSPEKWNFIVDKKANDDLTKKPACSAQQMTEEMRKKYASELLARGKDEENLASAYVKLLNEICVACGDEKYNETFRQLERFVNIPEFWEHDHKLQQLFRDFCGIRAFEIYSFIGLVHRVMEGATILAHKELQEKQEKRNQHEHERLEQNKVLKKKGGKEGFDNTMIPCFMEIFNRDKEGQRFGRKGPQLYFYKNCPRSWKIKFSTFRTKYAKWLDAGRPEKVDGLSNWTCPYAEECKSFEPEL